MDYTEIYHQCWKAHKPYIFHLVLPAHFSFLLLSLLNCSPHWFWIWSGSCTEVHFLWFPLASLFLYSQLLDPGSHLPQNSSSVLVYDGGEKKKSLTSYISTVFSCLIITLEVNCQLHGVNKNKSSSGTRMSFLCFTSLVYFIQKGWNSTWHLCLNRPKTRYTSYISFYSAICFIHIELNKYNQFSPLKIKRRKSNAPKWETQQPMLK